MRYIGQISDREGRRYARGKRKSTGLPCFDFLLFFCMKKMSKNIGSRNSAIKERNKTNVKDDDDSHDDIRDFIITSSGEEGSSHGEPMCSVHQAMR